MSRAMRRKTVCKGTGGHVRSRAICLNGLYSTPVLDPTGPDTKGDGRLPSLSPAGVSRADVPRAEQTRLDSACS
jgi:hypothetical protein